MSDDDIYEWALYLAAIVVAVFVLIGITGFARAHQAPSGWNYPLQCCSNKDCTEISGLAVKEKSDGYHVTVTPEQHNMVKQTTTYFIPYGDTKIKDSPDGVFHICISQQHLSPDASATFGGHVLCFFVPPRGF